MWQIKGANYVLVEEGEDYFKHVPDLCGNFIRLDESVIAAKGGPTSNQTQIIHGISALAHVLSWMLSTTNLRFPFVQVLSTLEISYINTPVCQHSKGAVSLDDAAHHADLLRPEQLQRQRLAGHQHDSCVWKHRDGLAAVVIVDRPPMKLLHV